MTDKLTGITERIKQIYIHQKQTLKERKYRFVLFSIIFDFGIILIVNAINLKYRNLSCKVFPSRQFADKVAYVHQRATADIIIFEKQEKSGSIE